MLVETLDMNSCLTGVILLQNVPQKKNLRSKNIELNKLCTSMAVKTTEQFSVHNNLKFSWIIHQNTAEKLTGDVPEIIII
jgi:hypothetical protein